MQELSQRSAWPVGGCVGVLRVAHHGNSGDHRKTYDAAHREWARKAGYFWFDCFQLGGGFPDAVIVSKTHIPVLVEVKSPGGKLTAAERKFRQSYPGPYCISHSPEELEEIMSHWDERDKVIAKG